MDDRHLIERFLGLLGCWLVILWFAGVVALLRWLF